MHTGTLLSNNAARNTGMSTTILMNIVAMFTGMPLVTTTSCVQAAECISYILVMCCYGYGC